MFWKPHKFQQVPVMHWPKVRNQESGPDDEADDDGFSCRSRPLYRGVLLVYTQTGKVPTTLQLAVDYSDISSN